MPSRRRAKFIEAFGSCSDTLNGKSLTCASSKRIPEAFKPPRGGSAGAAHRPLVVT